MTIKEVLRSKVDLTAVSAITTCEDSYRVCRDVSKKGYRAACIPSKFVQECRGKYPDIQMGTVVNYPYGLHGSNVVIREVQGVIGLCEDISKIEADVVCPVDIKYSLDMFSELNHLIGVKFILDWNYFNWLMDSIPSNVQKYPICTTLSIIKPTYLKDNKEMVDKVKRMKDKGYLVKVCGNIKTLKEVRFWVEEQKVDSIGTQDLKLVDG